MAEVVICQEPSDLEVKIAMLTPEEAERILAGVANLKDEDVQAILAGKEETLAQVAS